MPKSAAGLSDGWQEVAFTLRKSYFQWAMLAVFGR
jgi:hypothetical protein